MSRRSQSVPTSATMALASELYERHHMDVYRYARSWCRDDVLAKDVAHDIFLALAEGKTPTTNVKAYLFAAVRNLLIDEYRRNGRLAPVEAAWESPADEADRLAQLDARMPRTLAAVQNELTDDQRHVIVLRLIEGFTVKQTAQMLGKTMHNVKVLQFRGLARLRKALAVPSV